MSKRLDLTGQRFGRLTVVEFSHINKKGKSCWLCKCGCDNETIVVGCNLKSGDTKSCGCLQKENLKKQHKKQQLFEGMAACNRVLGDHKRDAKKRNLEQSLTDEQIIALHKGNCHYCGAPPSNICNLKNVNGSYIYNGIDRVDNTKGYTIDNVVSCCTDCNRAKLTRSDDEFKDWIKRIYIHLNL